MRKTEIDALLRAHKNRARPVAFFHILRQPTLEADDHAFLLENIDKLGGVDLLRWKARCEPGFTGAILGQIVKIAEENPIDFKHELLGPLNKSLDDQEWVELTDRLRGKVPPAVWEGILARGKEAPSPAPPLEAGELVDLSSLGLFDDEDSVIPAPVVQPDSGFTRALALAERVKGQKAAARKAALAAEAPGLTTRELVDLRKLAPHFIDEPELAAIAMDRALHSEEDWSAAASSFPKALREAVIEKLRRTPRGAERATLIEWLEAQGGARKDVLDIAIQALGSGEIPQSMLTWLAKQLGTRTAWERHGTAVLQALYGRHAFGEMSDLAAIVWSNAKSSGAPARMQRTARASQTEDGAAKLYQAVHYAFASAFIAVAGEAQKKGDEAGAMAALSALACLDPPSRASRAIHALRRVPNLTGQVLSLLEVNERLVKHSDARDASLEGIVAAIHALADASE